MSIFKYPYVTMLTSTMFENLTEQLMKSISIIKSKKTEENLSEQYNFFMILKLLKSNFEALNHCRLGLSTILKPIAYENFLSAYTATVKYIIEPGFLPDF